MDTLIFGGLCLTMIVVVLYIVLYHALTDDWDLETVDFGVDLEGFKEMMRNG